jgi:hypothetical protein
MIDAARLSDVSSSAMIDVERVIVLKPLSGTGQ